MQYKKGLTLPCKSRTKKQFYPQGQQCFSSQDWLHQGKEQVHSWAPPTRDKGHTQNWPNYFQSKSGILQQISISSQIIPGTALLTVVEEQEKLIWSYGTTLANLLHKSVQEWDIWQLEPPCFFLTSKAKTWQTKLQICGCHYQTTSLHHNCPCSP